MRNVANTTLSKNGFIAVSTRPEEGNDRKNNVESIPQTTLTQDKVEDVKKKSTVRLKNPLNLFSKKHNKRENGSLQNTLEQSLPVNQSLHERTMEDNYNNNSDHDMKKTDSCNIYHKIPDDCEEYQNIGANIIPSTKCKPPTSPININHPKNHPLSSWETSASLSSTAAAAAVAAFPSSDVDSIRTTTDSNVCYESCFEDDVSSLNSISVGGSSIISHTNAVTSRVVDNFTSNGQARLQQEHVQDHRDLHHEYQDKEQKYELTDSNISNAGLSKVKPKLASKSDSESEGLHYHYHQDNPHSTNSVEDPTSATAERIQNYYQNNTRAGRELVKKMGNRSNNNNTSTKVAAVSFVVSRHDNPERTMVSKTEKAHSTSSPIGITVVSDKGQKRNSRAIHRNTLGNNFVEQDKVGISDESYSQGDSNKTVGLTLSHFAGFGAKAVLPLSSTVTTLNEFDDEIKEVEFEEDDIETNNDGYNDGQQQHEEQNIASKQSNKYINSQNGGVTDTVTKPSRSVYYTLENSDSILSNRGRAALTSTSTKICATTISSYPSSSNHIIAHGGGSISGCSEDTGDIRSIDDGIMSLTELNMMLTDDYEGSSTVSGPEGGENRSNHTISSNGTIGSDRKNTKIKKVNISNKNTVDSNSKFPKKGGVSKHGSVTTPNIATWKQPQDQTSHRGATGASRAITGSVTPSLSLSIQPSRSGGDDTPNTTFDDSNQSNNHSAQNNDDENKNSISVSGDDDMNQYDTKQQGEQQRKEGRCSAGLMCCLPKFVHRAPFGVKVLLIIGVLLLIASVTFVTVGLVTEFSGAMFTSNSNSTSTSNKLQPPSLPNASDAENIGSIDLTTTPPGLLDENITSYESSSPTYDTSAIPTGSPISSLSESPSSVPVKSESPTLFVTSNPTDAFNVDKTVLYFTTGSYKRYETSLLIRKNELDIPNSDFLQEQLSQIPTRNGTAFLVNLGDWNDNNFNNTNDSNDSCNEQSYQGVSDFFSASSIPVYFVLGNNEFNDCSDPVQAKKYWSKYMVDYETKFWSAPPWVIWRQGSQNQQFEIFNENFDFTNDQNLAFCALSIPGGEEYVGDVTSNARNEPEYMHRESANLAWLDASYQYYRGNVDALIVLFNDVFPIGSNEANSKMFQTILDKIENDYNDMNFIIVHSYDGLSRTTTATTTNGTRMTTFKSQFYGILNLSVLSVYGPSWPPVQVTIDTNGNGIMPNVTIDTGEWLNRVDGI